MDYTGKQRVEALEKELEELKKELQEEKQTERWQDKLPQPQIESFYYIGVHSGLGFNVYSNHETVRKPEHSFRREEYAELLKDKMLLMQEMYAFAHVRNRGEIFNWNIGSEQAKFGIEMFEGRCRINSLWVKNSFVFGISVKSREIAEEMFDIFGGRIEKYYNEQY